MRRSKGGGVYFKSKRNEVLSAELCCRTVKDFQHRGEGEYNRELLHDIKSLHLYFGRKGGLSMFILNLPI